MNTDVLMVGRWMSIIHHPVDLSTVISAGWVTLRASLLQVPPMHAGPVSPHAATEIVFLISSVITPVMLAASVTGADVVVPVPLGPPGINLFVWGP